MLQWVNANGGLAVFKRLLNRHAASDFEPIDLKGLDRVDANKGWYEGIGATPLANLDFVGDLFRRIEAKDPVAFFSLYSNHIDEYTTLWGKPSFTYKGEYAWKAWVLKLSYTEQLILLSAKGGGSVFEVAGPQCNQWPPRLSDEAKDRLCRVILTLNNDVAGPKRRKIQSTIAERKKNSDNNDIRNTHYDHDL